MTAAPHSMTAHDAPSALQFAEDTLRAEQQAGLTLTAHHFHVLAGLVKAEAEREKEQRS